MSKAEIAYLKSQQKFDSLLFPTGFDRAGELDECMADPLRFEAPSDDEYGAATNKYFGEDEEEGVIGVRGRGTRS